MSVAVAIRSLRAGYSTKPVVEMQPFKRSKLYALLNITLPNRITSCYTLYRRRRSAALTRDAEVCGRRCTRAFLTVYLNAAMRKACCMVCYAIACKFLSFVFERMVLHCKLSLWTCSFICPSKRTTNSDVHCWLNVVIVVKHQKLKRCCYRRGDISVKILVKNLIIIYAIRVKQF